MPLRRNDGHFPEARYGCTSITNRLIVRGSVASADMNDAIADGCVR